MRKPLSPVNPDLECISSDSFQSAKDAMADNDQSAAKSKDNHFPSLRFSPNSDNDAFDNGKSKTNGNCTATQPCEKEDNTETNGKETNTLNAIKTMDDISINLFLEGK